MIETPPEDPKYQVIENGLVKLKYDKLEPRWRNYIIIPGIHILGLIGLVNIILHRNIGSAIFGLIWGILCNIGVTGGVHRLWSHRSFKANVPLRIFLAACYSIAGQKSIPQWVRDHRVHHKRSDTNADPHNANRGFFFSHVGWLMHKKHPDCIAEGKRVDMTDIYQDPVVMFHTRHFFFFSIMFCFAIPIFIPWFFWNETLWDSTWACFFRYAWTLNCTLLINSAAHIYGYRPFSSKIEPRENMFVSFAIAGEGWHNYHHTFPWDYKAAELKHPFLNITTTVIDLFAKIGWATNLKSPSEALIDKVAKKYGDGTREHVPEVDESGNILQHMVDSSHFMTS